MAIEIVDFPIKNGGSFHSYEFTRGYPQCLGALTHIDPAFLDDFFQQIQGARGVHVCLDAGGWDAMDPFFYR